MTAYYCKLKDGAVSPRTPGLWGMKEVNKWVCWPRQNYQQSMVHWATRKTGILIKLGRQKLIRVALGTTFIEMHARVHKRSFTNCKST